MNDEKYSAVRASYAILILSESECAHHPFHHGSLDHRSRKALNDDSISNTPFHLFHPFAHAFVCSLQSIHDLQR
jgi:hypothetical protein